MKYSTKSLKRNRLDYSTVAEWPEVTIVFSVFNEEKVIKRKLDSILYSDYPSEKLKILIGSDNSTDNTNAIINSYVLEYPQIQLIAKYSRHGKLKIINELVNLTTTQHLIFTDANVFFEPQTIKALVYHLVSSDARMVGGNIHKFSPKNKGISDQEIFYMNFENELKYHESLKYGFCVGVEGGCYAILKEHFVKVPDGFIMDDFFITLDVISKNGKVWFEPEALCFEDVNDSPLIEFKRKVRISLGNFRNLSYYKTMLFPLYSDFAFAFLSHKVLRWFTPFALIISFFISLALAFYEPLFVFITISYSGLLLFPVMAIWLERINLKIPVINSLGHFLLMNFGLFIGYIKFIVASQDSAWEPPKRNV
jgi:cellulose synthase/poly-beta-1,6-N-acetylglucosamine synthase-like glycosyltransferase